MKKLLIIFALLCSASALAQISTLQGKKCNTGSATTNACAFASNVASGSSVLVIARWDDSTTRTISSFTTTGVGNATCDSPGWRTATAKVVTTAAVTSNQAMASAWCHFTTGGSQQVTVTWSGSTTFTDVGIYEIGASSGLDKSASAAASSGRTTPCASGNTATLTQTGDLAIGYCGMWDFTTAWATTGSWTFRASPYSDSSFGVFSQTLGSTSAVGFSYAVTADSWTALTATFSPSGAAPAAPKCTLSLMGVGPC